MFSSDDQTHQKKRDNFAIFRKALTYCPTRGGRRFPCTQTPALVDVVTSSTNRPLTGGSAGHSRELYESTVLKYVVLMLSSLYLFGLNMVSEA